MSRVVAASWYSCQEFRFITLSLFLSKEICSCQHDFIVITAYSFLPLLLPLRTLPWTQTWTKPNNKKWNHMQYKWTGLLDTSKERMAKPIIDNQQSCIPEGETCMAGWNQKVINQAKKGLHLTVNGRSTSRLENSGLWFGSSSSFTVRQRERVSLEDAWILSHVCLLQQFKKEQAGLSCAKLSSG